MHTGSMFPIWFILEFLLFLKLISIYGFLNIFAFYTLPSFLGLLILIYYPKSLLKSLQNTMQIKEKPSNKMLHSLSIIISALFFIVPSVSTRLIGLFLFLPIFRHIIVFILMWQWTKLAGKLFNKVQNFNFTGKGFSVYTGSFGNGGFNKNINPDEYDDTNIIDVTPKHNDSSDNN